MKSWKDFNARLQRVSHAHTQSARSHAQLSINSFPQCVACPLANERGKEVLITTECVCECASPRRRKHTGGLVVINDGDQKRECPPPQRQRRRQCTKEKGCVREQVDWEMQRRRRVCCTRRIKGASEREQPLMLIKFNFPLIVKKMMTAAAGDEALSACAPFSLARSEKGDVSVATDAK